MKTVVIGESSGASREAIMAVYPRHKIVAEKFIALGTIHCYPSEEKSYEL